MKILYIHDWKVASKSASPCHLICQTFKFQPINSIVRPQLRTLDQGFNVSSMLHNLQQIPVLGYVLVSQSFTECVFLEVHWPIDKLRSRYRCSAWSGNNKSQCFMNHEALFPFSHFFLKKKKWSTVILTSTPLKLHHSTICFSHLLHYFSKLQNFTFCSLPSLPYLTHQIQVLQFLLMSRWVESSVINEGDIQNII